ncbi:tropomyosin-like isoform X2 [Epinephelus fuscoguttatus]|uniref:tropomyosin-like isoform X2 n=1 Tax=Epinephelus fuscoguttatus TaxID=293821 RepID=UPI0020D0B83F|nr:tropomyosin-like isoform X2 [Epinephelus fuscoguttatus]
MAYSTVQVHGSQLCGYVFNVGETVYRCRDCARGSQYLLCHDCLQSGIHKHHQYETGVALTPGWFCDCGVVKAWRTGQWCTKHGPANSVVPQHPELIKLAQAVIGPLKSGLQSFNTVTDLLLSVNADIVYPGCQTFDEIRREIESMKQKLERSEQVAKQELLKLDGDTERLTAEQSWLAKEKQKREGELQNYRIELKSHQESLERNQEKLRQARCRVREAEETYDDMSRRRDEAQIKRDVGIGLMAIPILGWIAGSVLIGVGQVDMDQASDLMESARSEVREFESQEETFSSNVSEYGSKISQSQANIQTTDDRIRQTEASLKDLSKKREVVADIQAKTRQAVRQLGRLSGVGSAAELQTRRLILLEPVMKVMEEMTSALGQITGDQLLYSEGIQSLMWDMRRNREKLLQLADTRDTHSDDDYY